MGLRITTWNVNGIRNPFAYQPWRDKRSFEAMFDILEADIVVFQETKIQRKDLSDDMVLVPGWDCYFSLPRHKKGYSGVVIYTRQSTCAPIRAEEGITGQLCFPNSPVSFANGHQQQQIGGYPSPAQLAKSSVDAITLDSEGRCVILEFPAFVLLGVYCPANRDETRDEFRLGFLEVLDARIRNLVALGKRVVLTGDLNISRDGIDTANAEASMRKQGLDGFEFVSTPSRRIFNQLLEGGRILGGRDEGRNDSVLWDICRAFHPDRRGMFTCWEQKVNARPGNCGARIDYVLCSVDMKGWFCDSNIQEGLMGSDHCPVYALIKEKVIVNGEEHHIKDLMNPTGMFLDGKRAIEYSSTTDPQQLSGRLLPEFSGRRNIRDMLFSKLSESRTQASQVTEMETQLHARSPGDTRATKSTSSITSGFQNASTKTKTTDIVKQLTSPAPKRVAPPITSTKSKKVKLTSPQLSGSKGITGQQSLKNFLTPRNVSISDGDATVEGTDIPSSENIGTHASTPGSGNQSRYQLQDNNQLPPQRSSSLDGRLEDVSVQTGAEIAASADSVLPLSQIWELEEVSSVHDPVVAKESWTKLFTKPAAPRCESHNETCTRMLTRKAGINLGRSFWMCPRPLGPSGVKEKNTQWRCGTFIWCSDWNTRSVPGD